MNANAAVIPVPIPWTAQEWAGLFVCDLVRDARLRDFVNQWVAHAAAQGSIKRCLDLLFADRAALPAALPTLGFLTERLAELEGDLGRYFPKDAQDLARVDLLAACACACARIAERVPVTERAAALELADHRQVMLMQGVVLALSRHFGSEPWSAQHRAH